MHEETIIAGFGGQGALFAGQLLAHAALEGGKHVTWIPSYGPEMRGGTAHCTVIVSDTEIGSPMVRRPGSVIALNQPSFEKYEADIRPGGWLVYNSSLINCPPRRTDIRYVGVPANDIGEMLVAVPVVVIILAAGSRIRKYKQLILCHDNLSSPQLHSFGGSGLGSHCRLPQAIEPAGAVVEEQRFFGVARAGRDALQRIPQRAI
jgi:2-oxoglutarate ferredoxin oxidoreductase subunit gamma